MLDAAELAQALAAHPGDVEAALSEYEQTMFPRSARIAIGSAELEAAMAGQTEEATAEHLIKVFSELTAGESPFDLSH